MLTENTKENIKFVRLSFLFVFRLVAEALLMLFVWIAAMAFWALNIVPERGRKNG